MVPKKVRPILGRAEFTKSLGVADRREAELIAPGVLAGWLAEIKNARVEDVPSSSTRLATEDDIDSFLLNNYFAQQRRIHNAVARINVTEEGAKFEEEKNRIKDIINYLSSVAFIQSEDRAPFVISQMKELGFSFPDNDLLRRITSKKTSQTLLDVYKTVYAEMSGENESDVRTSIIGELREKQNNNPKGENILVLFDQYCKQRLALDRKRSDTLDQDRKVIKAFAKYLSKYDVTAITVADIRHWRDALWKLPKNANKYSVLEKLDMRQVIAKPESVDLQKLSPVTINRYISAVSAFFSWCVTNHYRDNNPCQGLFLDIKKGKNARPPYSDEQLSTIFKSPLFHGFLKTGKEHVAGNHKASDWRYWIPLICLFTGARIGEVAQLRVDDIGRAHGFWCIHIREDDSRGQKTKSGKSRIAPVHSLLRALGFLAFVRRQRANAKGAGNEQLFPELAHNSRGQIGGKPSRFWREYLKNIGIKSGADGLGSHSFRHLLADKLRLSGYLDPQIGIVLGHSQSTVTSGYGRISQGTLRLLTEMIETVTFASVDFNPLIQSRRYLNK